MVGLVLLLRRGGRACTAQREQRGGAVAARAASAVRGGLQPYYSEHVPLAAAIAADHAVVARREVLGFELAPVALEAAHDELLDVHREG